MSERTVGPLQNLLTNGKEHLLVSAVLEKLALKKPENIHWQQFFSYPLMLHLFFSYVNQTTFFITPHF